ncbi:Gfo/Idh/MocA family protein [Flavobacterium sp. ZB4P23]|uniref:Gfo/Idh/MocA family protein n=1 Tax=Flavobacterium sp. ZB4P23 TaxID=2497484 RepID=UPI001E337D55|nr:Gfo/Idh/MocA family oxidoreductase [Flavobacterium sp. ZB4P23]
MRKKYKWGIIGCGNVTELRSGPAYQKVECFELHAVMQRNISKAEDYAIKDSVLKFYGDVDDLINDPEVDSLCIATPPDSHCYYALKVVASGKICCISKTMKSTYEEYLLVNNVFEEMKTPLFVTYYRRSLPRIKLEQGSFKESLIIKQPENIKFFHVQNIKNHLVKNSIHPEC